MLVFCDYDDTLTDQKRRVSQRSIEAIARFRASGGEFVVCTGRMHESIRRQLPKIGLEGVSFPLVSYQGALIKDALTDQTLRSSPIPTELAVRVADYFAERGLYLHGYVDGNVVAPESEIAVWYCRVTESPLRVVGDLAGFLRQASPPFKLLHISEPSDNALLLPVLRADFPQLNFCTSNPRLLEIVLPTATKGAALEFVAKRMGVALERTMAIGDSGNDLSMIMTAGIGVAMSLGDARLRAAADIVVDDVADALAHATKIWGGNL